MKSFTLVTTICIISSILGFADTANEPNSAKPIQKDIQLATHFLNALLRFDKTDYKVIVDADAEEAMQHIPLNTRNKELQKRLNTLRIAPSKVIKVNIHSVAYPKPWGSALYVYTYNTKTGILTEQRQHKTGENVANMWIRIDHWPNDTRLVRLSFTWIDDTKSDIFHLRKKETIFRHAIASTPLITPAK